MLNFIKISGMSRYFLLPVFLLSLTVSGFAAVTLSTPSENTPTEDQAPPVTVAYLKMESSVSSPLFQQFVLSGTIPVPKLDGDSCVFPRIDGKEPFKIRINGNLYPAQATVVTRYPQSPCAAIVQLDALVPNVNQMTLFEVVKHPHDKIKNPDPSDIRAVLSVVQLPQVVLDNIVNRPKSLGVYSADAFGNLYAMDLTQPDHVEVHKQGDYSTTVELSGVMRPLNPQAPNVLTRSLGVNAYLTVKSASECVELDMQFHNAFTGLTDDLPEHEAFIKTYFKNLNLLGPKNFKVSIAARPKYFGANTQQTNLPNHDKHVLVSAPAESVGKSHYMPAFSSFSRRIAICPAGFEAKGLAMLKKEDGWSTVTDEVRKPNGGGQYWSFSNKDTANFSPLREPLPYFNHFSVNSILAIRAKYNDHYNRIKNFYETGATDWDETLGNLGPFNPGLIATSFGSPYNTDPFGEPQIVYSSSRAGYLKEDLRARRVSERMYNLYFDHNGNPIDQRDFLVSCPAGSVYPKGQTLRVDGFKLKIDNNQITYNARATQIAQAVVAQHLNPTYEATIGQDVPGGGIETLYANKHWRFVFPNETLIYLNNDFFAKDRVKQQANLGIMANTSYPQYVFGNTPRCQTMNSTLLKEWEWVQQHPHVGFLEWGAGSTGVLLPATVNAFADMSWRNHNQPYFAGVATIYNKAQNKCMGSHISQAYTSSYLNYRSNPHIAKVYDIENSLVALNKSVLDDNPMVNNQLNLSYGMYLKSELWDEANHAFFRHIATAPRNNQLAAYCPDTIPADGFSQAGDHGNWEPGSSQWESSGSMVAGYQATGDQRYLNRLGEIWYLGPNPTASQILNAARNRVKETSYISDGHNPNALRALRKAQEMLGMF